MGIRNFKSGVLHLLFPQLCAGCAQPLLTEEVLLCLGCQQELARCAFHEDPENAAALRLAGRLPFRHATAFAHFVQDGLLQHLLHGLKYGRKKHYGRQLGRLFAWELQEVPWVRSLNMVIPVPLHPKKERARGYNQAALIAGGMALELGLPDGAAYLRRNRFTESQTQKSREERTRNVAGAFSLVQPEKIKNKHILLVDDVLTTGATLEAAAQALLQTSGVSVSFATIAIAD